jgi:hypothetical protein
MPRWVRPAALAIGFAAGWLIAYTMQHADEWRAIEAAEAAPDGD